MTWQNNCLGQIIWHAKFQNPIWTGVGGRIKPSLYNSVFNTLKRKADSINWLNVHLGQTIWYVKFGSITWQNNCLGQTIWHAKFQNPFWTGVGGRINPTLEKSIPNILKRKAGSITWQNACLVQTIWPAKFQNPGVGGRINPFLYNSVSISLKRKAGSITWQNGRLAKQFDTQSFRTLFGRGGGGGLNQQFTL